MRAMILALCLIAAPLARAQDTSVKHSIDRDMVSVGESVNYVIEVSSSGNLRSSNPEPPRLPGLQVVSSGTSDNLSIVNGQVSATRVYQYGLIPQKAGTFTIPPAKVEINGAVIKAEGDVVFKAVNEPHQAQGGQQQAGAEDEEDPNQPQQAPPASNAGDRSLFLKTKVTKNEVYQGEALAYSSALYSQHPFVQGTGIKEDASFPGFVVEPQQADNQSRQVRENNIVYYRAEVSRRILVPTKSGTLAIKPETLQVALRVRQRRRADPYDPFGSQMDDPFADFFAGMRPQIRFVSAPAVEVKVLPLPEAGKPAGFSGAVGTEFFVTSSLDKETLKESEVLTLRFTVKGRGDVRGVQEPKLEVGNDFKLFPAKATPKLDVTVEGLTGTKVFEIVLAPRGTGEKVIPGVKFSYFDTDQKKYVTKSTQAVKVTVTPGEKAEVLPQAGAAPTQPREDIKVLGRDIQFVKEDPSGLTSSSELVRGTLFWVSNVIPLGLVLFVWLWTMKRNRLESDVAWARRSRAYSAARKALGELRAGAGSMDARAFYARLDTVLLEFVAGKLNRSAAGLTQDQVREALTAAAVEERLVKRISDLLGRCEEMRFAPGAAGDAAARGADLDAADTVLAELEGVLS